ncbi:hypothetical protein [Haloarchaeobius sp. HRN-SO-5]|uniref:hypothetical protein n=1 Tax=Haloarchaeobius sp. HRN-SO-5 TaxID=3446118 RepID=UPI003EBA6D78
MTAVTTDGARTGIERRDRTERSFFVPFVTATPALLARNVPALAVAGSPVRSADAPRRSDGPLGGVPRESRE